ncbi:hypothetical protein BCR44DRAFT_1506943 [Catenaria anguillulae PL171]|uniref:Uncharacterized protein n=1 Tax=Catenaria anguillulae PL171 TaxID=765915 RepID=A0A1Y2H8B7_9FUNG|nr:hypothetical protein BCR44DRAFT_1506943 [Catenaria anguillulae PL171]
MLTSPKRKSDGQMLLTNNHDCKAQGPSSSTTILWQLRPSTDLIHVWHITYAILPILFFLDVMSTLATTRNLTITSISHLDLAFFPHPLSVSNFMASVHYIYGCVIFPGFIARFWAYRRRRGHVRLGVVWVSINIGMLADLGQTFGTASSSSFSLATYNVISTTLARGVIGSLVVLTEMLARSLFPTTLAMWLAYPARYAKKLLEDTVVMSVTLNAIPDTLAFDSILLFCITNALIACIRDSGLAEDLIHRLQQGEAASH